jgi:outer membrane protein insertion porin family
MPNLDVSTFVEQKTGIEAKLGHPLLDFTQMFLSYKFEYSYVDPSTIIDQNIIPKKSVNGFTSSLTAKVEYDKRDDRFDPREGLYASASTEWAGVGGDRRFIRTTGNVKYYHPIVWDFIFRFNLVGANIAATTSDPVPVNELYSLGGLYSLRGYDIGSIGPSRKIGQGDPVNTMSQAAQGHVPSLIGTDVVVGGHSQAYTNAEIEFPLLKEARIRGVLFFDAGNAFDDWNQIPGRKIKMDVGWGFRWFTPIGPLRFEFGYPIGEGGDTKFQFTIGPPF